MKKKKFIFPLLSVLIAVIFLAGSTGLTIIMHTCPACEDFYAKTDLFISPVEPEDDCCDAAENNCSSDGSITVEGTCCHFSIENIKLNNYTASVHYIPVLMAEYSGHYSLPLTESPAASITFPGKIHNKHGGRYLITYNCQIIS